MKARRCGYSAFHEKTRPDALSVRTCLASSSCFGQEGKLTLYCQVVNYLLRIYATDDIMAKVDAEIVNFKQPDN